MYVEKLKDLVGKTPLLKLNNYMKNNNIKADIYAKLEYFNPSGSAKDRAALYMIEEGIKDGKVDSETTIIEPTSGNTGIALASICAAMGNKLILTMPESMSIERRKILKAYGANIVLTPADEGMSGAIKKANALKQGIENSFIPGQFDNPANAKAHYETTGPEILRDMKNKVDYFVAGIGTGGTITGTGKKIKEKRKSAQIVGVEPMDSPVLSGGTAGAHMIQGIGAGFVPKVLDIDILDDIIKVSNEDAIKTAQELAKTEGVLCGISSGAALWAAAEIAKLEEGKNIVVLLPDTGERYISTALFDFE